MKNKQPPRQWYKLDNAAKIYPASMRRNWTALFRLSATLREPVDPDTLELALHSTLNRFPTFALRLRKGLFWFYLEQVDGTPGVQPDVANPLVRMDLKANNGFMFRIRYHDNRIAMEIFHALTDGTGGMCFLKTLVAEYLRLKHGADIPRDHEILDCSQAPRDEEMEDSFGKYARPATLPRSESPAYHVKGTPDDADYLNITTGIVPADALRVRAKEYGVTVTEYLVAALVMSIYGIQKKELSRRRRNRDVKICVPVNLRRFYPSVTVRNFSSFINPGITPAYGEFTFQEAATRIKHLLGLEASEKMINARMSKNVHDERNPVMRVVPLFLKNPTLKIAYWLNGDRVSSSTLSNLGVVRLPDEMDPYVERFDFQLGPLLYNPVTCACVTYKGNLVINFSRSIREPDVERGFFTFLVKEGLPVKIESNRRY